VEKTEHMENERKREVETEEQEATTTLEVVVVAADCREDSLQHLALIRLVALQRHTQAHTQIDHADSRNYSSQSHQWSTYNC